MPSEKKTVYVDISVKTIIKLLVVVGVLLLLFLIRRVIGFFLIAVVISSILLPVVEFLKRRKIPKTISVISIYLVFIGLIVFAFYLIVPLAITEGTSLVNKFPGSIDQIISNVGGWFGVNTTNIILQIKNYISSLGGQLGFLTGGVYNFTVRVVSAVSTAVLILVIAFYLTIEENAFKKLVKFFVPQAQEQKMVDLVDKVQRRMGLWLGGQMLLAFAVFILTLIPLLIFRVDYALVLALIYGILEVVPYFGPIIGGIVIAIVAFSQSFWLGIIAIIIAVGVQQLENHILVPKIMQKVVGLNPVITILAVLIGFELFGIVGFIIAIPVAAAISVIGKELVKFNGKGLVYKKSNNEGE